MSTSFFFVFVDNLRYDLYRIEFDRSLIDLKIQKKIQKKFSKKITNFTKKLKPKKNLDKKFHNYFHIFPFKKPQKKTNSTTSNIRQQKNALLFIHNSLHDRSSSLQSSLSL